MASDSSSDSCSDSDSESRSQQSQSQIARGKARPQKVSNSESCTAQDERIGGPARCSVSDSERYEYVRYGGPPGERMLWFFLFLFFSSLFCCWQEQQQESVCFKAPERTVRIVFGIRAKDFFCRLFARLREFPPCLQPATAVKIVSPEMSAVRVCVRVELMLLSAPKC